MIIFQLGLNLPTVTSADRFVAVALDAAQELDVRVLKTGRLLSRPLNSNEHYHSLEDWSGVSDVWLMSPKHQVMLHLTGNVVTEISFMNADENVTHYLNYLEQTIAKGLSYETFLVSRRKTTQKRLSRFQRRKVLIRTGLTAKQASEFLRANLHQSRTSRIRVSQLNNV